MKKILVMGLPGSGKTTLAEELKSQLQLKGKTVAWFNADYVRHINNDWDFSSEGRIRQAKRMKELANGMMTDYVICDFVAPTEEIREIFESDFTIWMNTEQWSNYQDTDKMFEKPTKADYTITAKDAKILAPYVAKAVII
jgi:adenylylsulfate kinase